MLNKIIWGVIFLSSFIHAEEVYNYTCEVKNKSCENNIKTSSNTIDNAKLKAFLSFSSSCESIKVDDINCTISEVYTTLNPISVNSKNTLNHTIVDVLYGTDRALNSKAILEERYTRKRDKLKFGVAQVSIPHSHVFGEIERPFFDFNEKIGKDIVVIQLDDINKNKFSKLLQRKLGKVNKDDILIFIHGYNVTFPNAIRQTAQLTYDLKFKGVPLTYSWTSQGGLAQYAKDEASVMYTIPKLVAFLEEVINNKGKAKIHILAHSMGTRALANALKDISYMYDSPQFKNVILAAPDIDAEVFESNLYSKIIKTTEKITIYTSSKDAALQLSHSVHDGKRLGEGGENISIFKDIVTIDASGLDTSFIGLGHSYFSQKEILVNDLRTLVHMSLPPQNRPNLLRKIKAKLFFWKFKVLE